MKRFILIAVISFTAIFLWAYLTTGNITTGNDNHNGSSIELYDSVGINEAEYIHYSDEKEVDRQRNNTGNESGGSCGLSGNSDNFEDLYVIPVGEPVGIYIKTDGVMIVDIDEVTDKYGVKITPCAGKLFVGDYIMAIDGEKVNDKNTLMKVISERHDTMTFEVKHNEKTVYVAVTPVETTDGNYKLGLWVKDDISGIGTLTFICGDKFGALGHSINDNDTGGMMLSSDGAIFPANIIDVKQPEDGKPGRLEGLINYTNQSILGRIETNTSRGIKGHITQKMLDMYGNRESMPVAKKNEVELGEAYIMSGVSGTVKKYEIEITRLDISDADNKIDSFQIELKSEELIKETGGIVQGMSGSPIIQNDKIIGAVTHVFVNDPTKGYGIFIEEMLY